MNNNDSNHVGGVTVSAKLNRETGRLQLRVVVVREDSAHTEGIAVHEIARPRHAFCDARVFLADLSFNGKHDSQGNTVSCAATFEDCPAHEYVVLMHRGAVIKLQIVETVD